MRIRQYRIHPRNLPASTTWITNYGLLAICIDYYKLPEWLWYVWWVLVALNIVLFLAYTYLTDSVDIFDLKRNLKKEER